MATSLTADAMLAALSKWGITPKFVRDDWRTHNRNSAQGFGPIYGFVVHNFGSDGTDAGSLTYLYNGDPLPPPKGRNLPGPLSQFAITDDGQVWVVGWGTANHTGSLDPRLHALVLKDAAPLSSDFRPNVNFGSAGAMHNVNDNYIGCEMTYGKAPTAAQRMSIVRLAAAIMDALGPGYTGGSVIGHREATTDRSDPVGFQMATLRRAVTALLAAGPNPAPPTPPEEPDMQFTDKVPNADFNVGEALVRGDWAYDQIVSTGTIAKRLATVEASNKALAAAVKTLSASSGMDPAALDAAIQKAVDEALADLKIVKDATP